MLINLSNHPYDTWSKEQKETAKQQFGEVVDMPFPNIPADANEDYVMKLAVDYGIKIENILEPPGQADNILRLHEDGVHLMGELTFCFALVDYLGSDLGIFYASTTERNVTYDKDGKKIVDFKFVKFRKYCSYWDDELYNKNNDAFDDDYDEDDYDEDEVDDNNNR